MSASATTPRRRSASTVAIVAVVSAWVTTASASDERLEVGGIARTYIAQLAPEAKRPAPLVIALHGNTQQGRDMATRTSWPETAERNGFSVLFPDGLNRAWADFRPASERMGKSPPDGTDDVAYIGELIRTYVSAGIADRDRVFVTGVSNGGAMTLTLACALSDRIAAVGVVIMTMTDGLAERCAHGAPMPIVFMNGTNDPLVPYGGGKGTSRYGKPGYWATERAVQFWRTRDGCEAVDAAATPMPHTSDGDPTAVVHVSSRCPPGLAVDLYRVEGGGHRMPSPKVDSRLNMVVTYLLGPQNHDMDGAEAIWAFFERASSPRR